MLKLVNKNRLTLFTALLWLAQPINAGSTDADSNRGFTFNILSSYYYNDNVTRSDSNAIDAYVFLLRPELGLEWGTSTSEFNLVLANETAKFEGSSEDNYSDIFLDFSADFALSSRHRLGIGAGIADTHEARGQGFSIGSGNNAQEVDTLQQNNFDFNYVYGRETAVAQLGFYYNIENVDYDARLNNLGADLTRSRDRQTNTLGASLTYEIGARTDLVVDFTQTENDYDVETGLGNTVDAILVGISWQATAKTTGRVQFGSQSRDLTLGGSDDSGIWLVAVDWSPKPYSTVSLSSSKSSDTSIGIGNSRDVENTTIGWNHEWNSQWVSNLSYSLEDTEFIGTNVLLDSKVLSLDLEYMINDLLTSRFYFSEADRGSNDNTSQLTYDQTIYGVDLVLNWF